MISSGHSQIPAWTQKQVLEVAAYLLAGWSAHEIAVRMACQIGTVKRRVDAIPKLHAIGFDGRTSQQGERRLQSLGFTDIAVPKSQSLKALDEAFDRSTRHLTFLAVGQNECKWPVNEPPRGGVVLFCGHDRTPGSNYCEHHAARSRQSRSQYVAEAA